MISFSETVSLDLSFIIVSKYSCSRLFSISKESHDSLNFLLKYYNIKIKYYKTIVYNLFTPLIYLFQMSHIEVFLQIWCNFLLDDYNYFQVPISSQAKLTNISKI